MSHFGTIRMPRLGNNGSSLKQSSSQLPTNTFASVAAAMAAASSVGQSTSTDSSGGIGMAGLSNLDITGTGTIRQSHFKTPTSYTALPRSTSHHRGQSAVCPQDLMLKMDTSKRKRASWDGGVA